MSQAIHSDHKKAGILAATPVDRCQRYLARIEDVAQNRKRIAMRNEQPLRTAVDAATQEASVRKDALQKILDEKQAVTEARAKLIDDGKKPLWSRVYSRDRHEKRLTELDDRRTEITARQRIAEAFSMKAIGALARTEREYKFACVDVKESAREEIAAANLTLEAISQTHRVLALWPDVAFGGFQFAHDIGGRVEKARETLRNPFATDIWGVPVNR